MKTSITILLLFISTIFMAQQSVHWIGGTPGQETSWNVAKNWSPQRVPDENSHVIIQWTNTGHQSQPRIQGEAIAASISIDTNASLIIEKSGALVLDGNSTISNGINFNKGRLINEGVLKFHAIDPNLTCDNLPNVQNRGDIIMDSLIAQMASGNKD